MNRKQIATGLIIAGVVSFKIPSVNAFLVDNVAKVVDNKYENYINIHNLYNNYNLGILSVETNTLRRPYFKSFIDINDSNLLKAINLSLNKDNLYLPISKQEILNTTSLDLSGFEITDLSGLEHFEKLQFLDISNNKIEDISSLSNLQNLKEIKAFNNNIRDISCLKDLNLKESDFSNQNIYLEDTMTINDMLTIKNPICMDSTLDINYTISNNGIYQQDTFTWNNLFLEDYNLEVLFEGNNESIKFSGTIFQRVFNDTYVKNNINIELLPNTLDWVNTDLIVKYKISGNLINLIKEVGLPNGEISLSLNGDFSVPNNGNYLLKIFFNNGDFIEKNIDIQNIDKEKPTLNLITSNINDDNVFLKLEANDNLSGIDYILLPNNEKIYNNYTEYTSDSNEVYYIKAFDLAGNYDELAINFQDIEDKLPILNVSDKTVTLGSPFNALKDVSAIDYKGNDITNNIKVLSNSVNVNSLGEYTVVYSVFDSEGNRATKSIMVYVINKEEDNDSNLSHEENIFISDDDLQSEVDIFIDKNKNNNIYSNKEILQSLESTPSNNENIENNSLNIKNIKGYSTAIVFSMFLGFLVFFKSGKDNF